jgi:hypothetical protein
VQVAPATQAVDALEIGGDRWIATQTQILLAP